MRINLIKVGNSKGIIIPSALLASCELKDTVELQLEGKKLVIAAVKQPRSGWFEGYRVECDESALESIPQEEGADEWVW